MIDCRTIKEITLKKVMEDKTPKGKVLILYNHDNDPNARATEIYLENKLKLLTRAGFCVHITYCESAEKALQEIIHANDKDEIIGVIVQSPFMGMDVTKVKARLSEVLGFADNESECANICNFISPNKDIDRLSCLQIYNYTKGDKIYGATATGLELFLEVNDINVEGKTVLVIGRSLIAGKQISAMFLNQNATVIQAHSKTTNLEELLRISDIVVSCVGKAHFIKKENIKRGALLFDVGMSMVDGKLLGDFDPECERVANYMTPTPNGTGQLTQAGLLILCSAFNKSNQ